MKCSNPSRRENELAPTIIFWTSFLNNSFSILICVMHCIYDSETKSLVLPSTFFFTHYSLLERIPHKNLFYCVLGNKQFSATLAVPQWEINFSVSMIWEFTICFLTMFFKTFFPIETLTKLLYFPFKGETPNIMGEREGTAFSQLCSAGVIHEGNFTPASKQMSWQKKWTHPQQMGPQMSWCW